MLTVAHNNAHERLVTSLNASGSIKEPIVPGKAPSGSGSPLVFESAFNEHYIYRFNSKKDVSHTAVFLMIPEIELLHQWRHPLRLLSGCWHVPTLETFCVWSWFGDARREYEGNITAILAKRPKGALGGFASLH